MIVQHAPVAVRTRADALLLAHVVLMHLARVEAILDDAIRRCEREHAKCPA